MRQGLPRGQHESRHGGQRHGQAGSRRRSALALVATTALGAGALMAMPVGSVAASPAAAPGSATASGAVADSVARAKARTTTVVGKVAGGGGMRLIAVAANGRATVRVLPGSGAFSLPVSTGTSLHLTTSGGDYYGPVMLRGNGKGKKGRAARKAKASAAGAITGSLDYGFFKAGAAKKANLGVVRLRGGWAAPAKPASANAVITSRASSSQAVRGVPIGAGNSGRVAVAASQALAAPSRPGNDFDRDGIIGAFDVDDNGNLKLDNVDNSNVGGSVRLTARDGSLDSTGFRMFSNYKATEPSFSDVVNANVKVPTTAELDASTRTKLGLAVQVIPGATLGCTGQVYCPASPMPLTTGPTGDFQWRLSDTYPGLTAADVNPGDTFVETGPDGIAYPGVLNFVFRTTPALLSYQFVDGSGNALAPEVAVDYTQPNPVGSANNRINVSSGNRVKLTFWRPQRQAFASEAGGVGGYVDIGNLSYMADNPNSGGGGCPATAGDSAGATVSDGSWTNVQDTLGDAATDAGRTLSMIVDAKTCAGARSDSDLDIQAKSLYGDNAAQKIYFSTAS